MTKLPKICPLQGILKLARPERETSKIREGRKGGGGRARKFFLKYDVQTKKGEKYFPFLKLGVSDWDSNPVNVRLQPL
jgi:hypothetical protein